MLLLNHPQVPSQLDAYPVAPASHVQNPKVVTGSVRKHPKGFEQSEC